MGHTKVRCKEPLVDEGGAVANHDDGGHGVSTTDHASEPANMATDINWGSSVPAAVANDEANTDW